MTEATLEHGVYSRSRPAPPPQPKPAPQAIGRVTRIPPGSVEPWDQMKPNWPPVIGDEELVKDIWAQTDGLAYLYLWQILVSF